MMTRFRFPALGLGVAALAMVAAPLAAQEPVAPERLVVSFTPEAAPIELELNAEQLVGYLSEELGMPVIARVDADYTGTVEAMRAGHAHIAFLSPLASALAHEHAGARMILAEERHGLPYYKSRYWVLADSGIESLEDLQGRTVAFNDPLSASGYLFPVANLIEAGLIEGADDLQRYFERVYFAGGTELSLRALVNGFVDAAGVSIYGPEVFLSPEERERLTWIAEHGPIPNHGIAADGRLPDELVERITAAFIALNEPEHNHVLRGLYGWQKVVPVETEMYLPLIEMARAAGMLGR